uniref:Uncharacterized protein n=1 Tax=Ditylenchus dipsaci TaxID=166011 RepID=A0A915ES11_9BILA
MKSRQCRVDFQELNKSTSSISSVGEDSTIDSNTDLVSITVTTAINSNDVGKTESATVAKTEKSVDSAKRKLTAITQSPITENLERSYQPSPQPLSSTSLSNITDGKDPKKSHHSAFMNLFSGKSKQQPPNSLENLTVKVVPKSQKDANPATTPGCSSTTSSSMGFLQKLPFHYLHSNSKHEKVAIANVEMGTSGLSPMSQDQVASTTTSQVHPLCPVKELESPIIARHILQDSSPITGSEETWYPASEQTVNKQDILKMEAKATILERDAIQKALDELLTEFRSGRMKALSDKELEEMRAMHYQQLQLSALHMEVYKQEMDLYDPITRKSNIKGDDLDDQYVEISKQLDHLHDMMDSFHT